ncbi:MAG TPA: biotin/lipoyl-containing protein, partial [Polyangiaceae bacterium]|nr:biotin/lipoyl-containing protein [Polyangiaceae bacterium]
MIDVTLPQLGESVSEGTITKWLVREGDYVKKDQPIVEIGTDKADSELPAPAAGRVTQILAKEGDVLPVNSVLCHLDETAAAGASAAVPPPPPPAPVAAAAPVASPAVDNVSSRSVTGSALASPTARKTALENEVNLDAVQGSGERGRITRDDVLRAAAGNGPSGPARHEPEVRGEPRPTFNAEVRGEPRPTFNAEVPAPAASRIILQEATAVAPVSTASARNVSAPSAVSAQPSPAAIPAPSAGGSSSLARLINQGGGFVPPIPGVGYGSFKVPAYKPNDGDKVVPFTRRRRITADHMTYSKFASPHVVTVAEIDLNKVSQLRDAHKDRYKKEGHPLTVLAFVVVAVARAL